MFYFNVQTRNMLEASENAVNLKIPQICIEKPEDYENNQNHGNVGSSSKPQEVQKTWQLSDFKLGRKIAQGNFGVVYSTRENCSNKLVALKILFKTQLEKKDLVAQVKNEVEIHTHLKHVNIIRMYGFFHDESRVFMVLDLAVKGDLLMALQAEPSKRFNNRQTILILEQLIEAMKFLHKRRVIHRDIKPDNLLLSSENQLKLADFGWAVCYRRGQSLPPCGIRNNMAPEMFSENNGSSYDCTADLWAMGVLVYHFIAGVNPFVEENKDNMIKRICAANYAFPSFVSAKCRDFISKLIVLNPSERLSLDEISKHKWMLKNLDELNFINAPLL